MDVTWEQFFEKTAVCLSPSGSGIYTLSTGGDRREHLQNILYGETSSDKVREAWLKKLPGIKETRIPLMLGICSDSGGGILRGAAWGPLFVRSELLKKDLKYIDWGDVRVIPHLLHDKYLNNNTLKSCRQALYKNAESSFPVSPLSIAEETLNDLYSLDPDKKVFGLGGDHSCSYPLVKSFLKSKRRQGKKVALIHFDAHTDLLNERLGVDICFGTWTAHILSYLPSPDYCFQLGIRATLGKKEYWESQFGIKQYWADEILSEAEAVWDDLQNRLQSLQVDELYISFDIDALDASYAPCTGTPELKGLAPHHCVGFIQRLAKLYPITGADLMEVAPLTQGMPEAVKGDPQRVTLLSASAIASTIISSM